MIGYPITEYPSPKIVVGDMIIDRKLTMVESGTTESAKITQHLNKKLITTHI